MTRLLYSAAALFCLSVVSCNVIQRFPNIARARQDEPFQAEMNNLQVRQSMVSSDEIIPPEDPNLVVVRPAGGDVVPFGGGIHNLLVSQGVAEPAMANDNRQAISPFGTNTGTATGTATGTGAAVVTPAASAVTSAATPAAVTASVTAAATTAASSASSASSAASTFSSSTAASVTGSSISSAPTPQSTGATGAIISTASTARPATTAAAYGASPSSYGSSPSSSYGSSSYGSSSGSGSSSSSSQNVNSIGVPYGDYNLIPYFPYAPSAASQITHPLIFSPNLPIPSYINKYFGLNLPLNSGK